LGPGSAVGGAESSRWESEQRARDLWDRAGQGRGEEGEEGKVMKQGMPIDEQACLSNTCAVLICLLDVWL
jgi:hypothetical protein